MARHRNLTCLRWLGLRQLAARCGALLSSGLMRLGSKMFRALLEAALPILRLQRMGAFEWSLVVLLLFLLPGHRADPAMVVGSVGFLLTLFAGASEAERAGVRVPFEGTPLARFFLLNPFAKGVTDRDRWRWGLVYTLPWAVGVWIFWAGLLGLRIWIAIGGLALCLAGRKLFLSVLGKWGGGTP